MASSFDPLPTNHHFQPSQTRNSTLFPLVWLDVRKESEEINQTVSQLLYATLINTARIHSSRSSNSNQEILQLYHKALKLDDSDPHLWHLFGQTAERLDQNILAALAFQQASSLSDIDTPHRRKCTLSWLKVTATKQPCSNSQLMGGGGGRI